MRTQKGGSLKTLEGFIRGRTTKMYLENEDIGRGVWRKSSKVIKADHFSEVTFKEGIG